MRLSLFRLLALVVLGGLAPSATAFEMPVVTPLADGLKNPESVAVGFATVDGKGKFTIVVSEIGEFGTDGDGKISEDEYKKARPGGGRGPRQPGSGGGGGGGGGGGEPKPGNPSSPK